MKVKWDWLAHEDMVYFSQSWPARIVCAPLGFIFTFIACWIVQGGILGTTGPDALTWLICTLGVFGLPVLMTYLPSIHYLHGVSGRTRDALAWYGTLTSDEKKQLPKDWDDIVRQHGEMTVPHEDDYVIRKTVAGEMLDAGRRVVNLYRDSQKALDKSKTLDYRVPVQLQLMAERAEDLEQSIKDQNEIEDKIARMP